MEKHKNFNRLERQGKVFLGLAIVLYTLILVSSSVSSWSSNQFNNSLTEENLTFSGVQNISRSLTIPQNIFVTSGFFNISFVSLGIFNLTYGESQKIQTTQNTNPLYQTWTNGIVKPNLTNVDKISMMCGNACGGGECWLTLRDVNSSGGVDTGVNLSIGSQNPMVFADGDWMNFTMIPRYNLVFGKKYAIVFQCDGGANLRNKDGGSNYAGGEEGAYGGIVWTGSDACFEIISSGYNETGNQVNISLDESWINNFSVSANLTTGFTGQTKSSNLASYLNHYLLNCTYISGFCESPFIFRSSGDMNIRYSSLEFNNFGFIENSQIYNSTSYETSLEGFIINISYDTNYYSSISANLVYNNTKYSSTKIGTGNNIKFSKQLTIPSLTGTTSQIKPFYWEVILTNSTKIDYYNSTKNNQTINPILFIQCNGTYPIVAVNFSIFNESGTTQNINATFKANFEYSIGSSTISKNISYNLASNHTFSFCISHNSSYMVSSSIQLTSLGFFDNNYDLSEYYSNTTTEKKLFMTATSIGRQVIVEVKSPSLQPLVGYKIKIYKYYPDLGKYIEIVSQETDYYGQFITSLVENTVKYKFEFYDSNGVLKKSTEDYTYVACRSTICILQFLIENAITEFDEFTNITDYDYDLNFNNNTNIFTFSWNDNSGQTNIKHRLLVERTLANGTTVICNSSSATNLLIGSLTCDVGSQKGSYQAQAFRRSDVVSERRIKLVSVSVGDTSSVFGIEGLFWSFILLMTSLALGYYAPPVGAGLFAVGFIILGIMGIVYVNPAIYIAIIVICAVFAWAFRG